MFKEIITYMATPCQSHIRRMGYLYETIAMRERYKRNRSSWQPHLDKSRKAVLSAAKRIKNRNKIMVMGSGLLLDVPIDELSSIFKEVVLSDIIHLPEVRRRIKKLPNVRLIEQDAVGISEKLFQNIKNGLNELPCPSPCLSDSGADLVVSLNMLSQLPIIPHIYAMKNMPEIPENELKNWCRQIVESHIFWLKSLPCATCTISDHSFTKKNIQGNIIETGSTVYGTVLPEPEKSWIWNLAPCGEECHDISKELYIGVWS